MNKYHKIFNRSTRRTGSFAAYCAARTADCGYCGLRTCGTTLPVGVCALDRSIPTTCPHKRLQDGQLYSAAQCMYACTLCSRLLPSLFLFLVPLLQRAFLSRNGVDQTDTIAVRA